MHSPGILVAVTFCALPNNAGAQGAAGYTSRADIPSGCELTEKLPVGSRCIFDDQCASGFCCPYYRNCQGPGDIPDWSKDELMNEILYSPSIGGEGTNGCNSDPADNGFCLACNFKNSQAQDTCITWDKGSGAQPALAGSSIASSFGAWDLTNPGCGCDQRFLDYMLEGKWVPQCSTLAPGPTPAPGPAGPGPSPAASATPQPTSAPTSAAAGGGSGDMGAAMEAAATNDDMVTGSMELSVADPEAFVKSSKAKLATEEAIASVAGVSPTKVLCTLEQLSRRRLSEQGAAVSNVRVKYQMTLSSQEASRCRDRLDATRNEDIASTLADELQDADAGWLATELRVVSLNVEKSLKATTVAGVQRAALPVCSILGTLLVGVALL